jgi:hypothetical protein
MKCSACGNELSDGSVFCEFCGADMRFRPVVASPAAATPTPGIAATARTAVVNSTAAPSAAAFAELGGMLLKSMSLGEKLAGAGALAATLGFFLPWVSGPNLASLGNLSSLLSGTGTATTSYSGFDVTKIWGGIYLILAAAIASGVLVYISGKAVFSRKLMISGFQVMIGSIIGPAVIVELLFIPFMQSVAGMGMWLLGLGFCSIAAGGLVTINQLGKMVR